MLDGHVANFLPVMGHEDPGRLPVNPMIHGDVEEVTLPQLDDVAFMVENRD
jgi:hypothetical protein